MVRPENYRDQTFGKKVCETGQKVNTVRPPIWVRDIEVESVFVSTKNLCFHKGFEPTHVSRLFE